MSEPEGDPSAAPDEEVEGGGLDRWLTPVFSDPALGPVLIVFAASFGTFGAALLLLAWRSHNPFAIAAGVILFWITVDVVRRDVVAHRLGYASRVLLGLWGLSVAAAGAAVWLGIY